MYIQDENIEKLAVCLLLAQPDSKSTIKTAYIDKKACLLILFKVCHDREQSPRKSQRIHCSFRAAHPVHTGK